ncbi:unnamed protein product, partial [Symbiodinium microadriaticum]
LGTLWQRFYCLLFGAFKAADLTKARRGLYHGDARPVLHDCFCGINKDFAESTIEAASQLKLAKLNSMNLQPGIRDASV